jgi:CrcB protein
MLAKVLTVGAGGFIGASARYLVGGLVYRILGAAFPLDTLLINVSGCLAIGFLAVLAEERASLGAPGRLFLIVGVLGGYTTFSTFGYETVRLMREGSYPAAWLNVVGQVSLGLAAVWLGAALARSIP